MNRLSLRSGFRGGASDRITRNRVPHKAHSAFCILLLALLCFPQWTRAQAPEPVDGPPETRPVSSAPASSEVRSRTEERPNPEEGSESQARLGLEARRESEVKSEAEEKEVSFALVAARVQPNLVKVYGAGGVRGIAAYQSGFLISPEGHILTAWTLSLDVEEITVVLHDGRQLQAQHIGSDPRLGISLLKVDGENLPHFDLQQSVHVESGSRVLAFSNLFNIAAGAEPLSVQHGSISVTTNLNARRGMYDTPYRGPVYVLDAITNNPGAVGGALTDRQGRLVGMLGKELRNSLTNTWLNYALPAEQLRLSVEDLLAGKTIAQPDQQRQKPQHPLTLASLGFSTVPDIVARTPPYIDAVRKDSPAQAAGLRRDDLIVMLDNQLTPSCQALKEAISYLEDDAEVLLTIVRGAELVEARLRAAPSVPTRDLNSPSRKQ